MRNFVIILFVLFGFIACKKSKHPGYSLSKTGLDYKFHMLGDEDKSLQDSDMISLNIRVYSLSDTNLFTGEITQMYHPKQDSGFNELLGFMVEGDSVSAYFSSATLKHVLNIGDEIVRVELTLVKKWNYSSWLFYQKYPELSKDLEMAEQVSLQQILGHYKFDSIEVANGMFVIREVIGHGQTPKKGDEVVAHYTAKSGNGKLIDSTYERNQPFTYIIGQQGQVIRGFDYGIRTMRKGGKAIFIIPSLLAFGSTGSSTGIAKEYETLIYKVELIDILRADSTQLTSE